MTPDNPASQASDHLLALARRLEQNPAFMASVLKQYREQTNLTELALIAQLETTPDRLVRLALCKRPDRNSPQFAEQLQQLADYTGIPVDHLQTLLEQVQS